jgi:outer membrane protein
MRLITTLLLLVVLSVSSAFAQSARQVTLEEAVNLALNNNIALQQAINRMDLQDANVTSALYDFFPNLNAGFNGNRTTGRQFVQETLQFDDFTTQNVGGSLNSNVIIFDGLRNISALRNAQTLRLSAEETLQRNREMVIFNTATSFLTVILDKELLVISNENLQASLKQLEQIRAQVEVGMRPMVDLYNQEALTARSELDVINQENRLNISTIQLLRIMAVDPLLEYDFVMPEIDESALVQQTFSLQELVDQAMANRRDVRSTEIQITSARYNMRIARGAYLPTVSLSASLSSNYSDQYRDLVPVAGGGFTREPVGFFDQFTDRNPRRSYGFNVQIPIFNRYNTARQVQASRVEYKNSLLELESKKLEVFQEVRQAYNDYIAVTKQLETTERALLAATRAYETEQERYRVGASTLIELTRSQAEFVSASSNRVQAVYRFVFQEKLLEYYLGRITTEL